MTVILTPTHVRAIYLRHILQLFAVWSVSRRWFIRCEDQARRDQSFSTNTEARPSSGSLRSFMFESSLRGKFRTKSHWRCSKFQSYLNFDEFDAFNVPHPCNCGGACSQQNRRNRGLRRAGQVAWVTKCHNGKSQECTAHTPHTD